MREIDGDSSSTPPPPARARSTRKIAILAVIVILVVAMIAVFFFVKVLGPKDRISIDAVSLEWEYNQYFHGYVISSATITVTNNGNSKIFSPALRGQLGENQLGDFAPDLAPGETKTYNALLQVQSGLQSGTYTLTLRMEDFIGTQVYGQRTMSIHIP